MNSAQRLMLQVTGTLLLPFLCLTVYLAVWGRNGTTESGDYLALGISIAAGLATLLTAPLVWWKKTLAALVYVLAMGAALVIYALGFVCGAYGRCV